MLLKSARLAEREKEKKDDIATQHIAADTTTTTTTTKTLNAGAVTGENTSQGKHVYIT